MMRAAKHVIPLASPFWLNVYVKGRHCFQVCPRHLQCANVNKVSAMVTGLSILTGSLPVLCLSACVVCRLSTNLFCSLFCSFFLLVWKSTIPYLKERWEVNCVKYVQCYTLNIFNNAHCATRKVAFLTFIPIPLSFIDRHVYFLSKHLYRKGNWTLLWLQIAYYV